ncbi:hypothetical protein Acr_24g0008000 [Actinidia rufa]|uniref:Uncharacterized protein n=1 Tax=Actinidia rufa TaxID=165716 RepID=A0A7J0GUU4_9ERIC|nr:hypothetical protein Acr_24g0008000 [Actinidia rufa]
MVEVVVVVVVVKIWASNQQSILLGILGTGPQVLKGRPAQTNKSKRPWRGRSRPLRRGDQTKMMTADRILEGSGGDSKYSTSPKGRGGDSTLALGELMSTPMVALASSVEMTWRSSMGSFYLGQEGSKISNLWGDHGRPDLRWRRVCHGRWRFYPISVVRDQGMNEIGARRGPSGGGGIAERNAESEAIWNWEKGWSWSWVGDDDELEEGCRDKGWAGTGAVVDSEGGGCGSNSCGGSGD